MNYKLEESCWGGSSDSKDSGTEFAPKLSHTSHVSWQKSLGYEEFQEMLVWAILVGVSVNGQSESKSWFVRRMADVARDLAFQVNESGVAGRIGSFPWV